MNNTIKVLCLLLSLSLVACQQPQQKTLGVFNTKNAPTGLDLDVIQQNGELIVVSQYGKDTYFEYYGEGFGTQYMIAREYAKNIGCTIRIDVMTDSTAMSKRLADGEADIALMPETDDWIVRTDAPMLAQSLRQWVAANRDHFKEMTAIRISDEKGRVYTQRRKVYSPILNAAAGQISQYDHLFRKYAQRCGWEWQLLAAQAYQESCFDSHAVSYMGALGLMQLMPRTAASAGISISQAFDPETNLRGAVQLISKLNRYYSDITDPDERINFILAAYNGGQGHIDDARALASTLGLDPNRWPGNVAQCVLRLSESRFFNNPAVRHGYMRGSETYNYVNSIRSRWSEYRKVR